MWLGELWKAWLYEITRYLQEICPGSPICNPSRTFQKKRKECHMKHPFMISGCAVPASVRLRGRSIQYAPIEKPYAQRVPKTVLD